MFCQLFFELECINNIWIERVAIVDEYVSKIGLLTYFFFLGRFNGYSNMSSSLVIYDS